MQTITTTPATTNTTSASAIAPATMISKQVPHFNQLHSTRYEADTLSNSVSFSNSEPPSFTDQIVHDINCAKNKNSYSKATNNAATSNI